MATTKFYRCDVTFNYRKFHSSALYVTWSILETYKHKNLILTHSHTITREKEKEKVSERKRGWKKGRVGGTKVGRKEREGEEKRERQKVEKEREREGEREEREREKEKERERECVCVRERERASKRERERKRYTVGNVWRVSMTKKAMKVGSGSCKFCPSLTA